MFLLGHIGVVLTTELHLNEHLSKPSPVITKVSNFYRVLCEKPVTVMEARLDQVILNTYSQLCVCVCVCMHVHSIKPLKMQ